LKRLGILSGLGAANLLFGAELKAAVLDLVQISYPEEVATTPGLQERKYRPLATGTVPRAFSQEQLDLLAQLVELIIPTTDTPGARAAGAHWYIDAVAEVDAALRQELKEGLAWLGERSKQQFGQPFLVLNEVQQVELLTLVGKLPMADPGRKFFELVKQGTLSAYYQSEIGLLQELGWVGHEYLPSFPGCPHPDPSHRRTG